MYVCERSPVGLHRLAIVDSKAKSMKEVPTEFQVIDSVYATTQGQDDMLLMTVGSYNVPSQVINYNLRTNEYDVLMKSSSVEVPQGWISKPEPLTFKTTNGLGKRSLLFF